MNKKIYIQPIVEAVNVQAISLMNSASPLLNSGQGTLDLGGGEIIGG